MNQVYQSSKNISKFEINQGKVEDHLTWTQLGKDFCFEKWSDTWLKTKGINNLEPIAEYVKVPGGLAIKSLKIL